MLNFKNKSLLKNWKDNKEAVYALFSKAKLKDSYIKSTQKIQNAKDREIFLSDYDLATITGEKNIFNNMVQEIICDGKEYDLNDILYSLFGKDSLEYHQFIKKFIPSLEPNSYQIYSMNIARRCLVILNTPAYQSKEMKKTLRKVKGLKAVLNNLAIRILTFPPKSKPIDTDELGVIINVSLSSVYNQLDGRLKKQWPDTVHYPQLKNIFDILVCLGVLKKLKFEDFTEPQKDYFTDRYQDKLYTMPNWYLCFHHLEEANWKKVNDLNLNSEQGIAPALAEKEFSYQKAQNLKVVSVRKHDKKTLDYKETSAIVEEVKKQGYLTLKDAAKVATKAHFLFGYDDLFEEKSLEWLRKIIKTGYFEHYGIQYVGIKKLRRLGYNTDLKGRTKVLVEVKKAEV